MRRVSIRQLARQTAATIKEVSEGGAFLVTSNDRPVAMLTDLPEDIALRELPLGHPRVQEVLARRRHGNGAPAAEVVARLRAALATADRRSTSIAATTTVVVAKLATMAGLSTERAGAIVDAIVVDVAEVLTAGGQQPVNENDPWVPSPGYLREGLTLVGRIEGSTDVGFFVELLPGIQGLLRVSEIPADRLDAMRQAAKQGALIRVTISDIDEENRRIALAWAPRADAPQPIGLGEVEIPE